MKEALKAFVENLNTCDLDFLNTLIVNRRKEVIKEKIRDLFIPEILKEEIAKINIVKSIIRIMSIINLTFLEIRELYNFFTGKQDSDNVF